MNTANIRNPTSATKALARSAQLKILPKEGSQYEFTHPFFKAWLKQLP